MNWFQELTDILRCKILQLTGQISYPLSILPKKYYVSRMNIDAICEKIPLVVEFQLTDILQNKLISDIKSAWKINAAEIALQQIISANASINCREIRGIPTSYFHKNL